MTKPRLSKSDFKPEVKYVYEDKIGQVYAMISEATGDFTGYWRYQAIKNSGESVGMARSMQEAIDKINQAIK